MSDERPTHRRPEWSLTRRRAAGAFALAGAAAVAGCLAGGRSASRPSPVDLSGGKTDDQGGMVIGLHAGPNGQVFYRNYAPEGHDNPAWFHTLSMGLFPYYFAHERRGWTAEVVYVTDYARVDYDLTTDGDDTFISTHTAPDTFGNAREMTYVADSDVLGGMGADLLPFSDDEAADTFVEHHGGRTVTFREVTPEWLAGYLHS